MLKCPYLLSLEYTKELNNSYKNILISWQFTKRPKLSENLISYYNGRYQMLYVRLSDYDRDYVYQSNMV